MTINACENVLRESTNSLLVEVHICTDTVVFSMQVLKKRSQVTDIPLFNI